MPGPATVTPTNGATSKVTGGAYADPRVCVGQDCSASIYSTIGQVSCVQDRSSVSSQVTQLIDWTRVNTIHGGRILRHASHSSCSASPWTSAPSMQY